jgi:hypothetical protein
MSLRRAERGNWEVNGELNLNFLLPVLPTPEHWRDIVSQARDEGIQFFHLGDLEDGGVSEEDLIREIGRGIPVFARPRKRDENTKRFGSHTLALSLVSEATSAHRREGSCSVLCLSFPDSVSTREEETSLYLGPAWRSSLFKLLNPIARVLNPPIGCSSPIFTNTEEDDDCADELGWLNPDSRNQLIPRLTELTYLGKAAADRLGRAQLDSLPGAIITGIPLGGVLIDLLSAPPSAGNEGIEDITFLPSRHLGLPKVIAI